MGSNTKNGNVKNSHPVLVFDHDGTLHDSIHVYAPAVHMAEDWIRKQGYAVDTVDDEVIASCFGQNSIDMWERFGYHLPEEMNQEMVKTVALFVGKLLKEGVAKWFDGTTEMLDVLKSQGYRMVILSNCEKSLADFYWEHFGMEKWFDRFYDCESFDFLPKTEIIKVVLDDYGGNGIMIGDRYMDMECARAGRIPFLGCSYGFAGEGELDGSDALVDSPAQIPEKICLLEAQMSKRW